MTIAYMPAPSPEPAAGHDQAIAALLEDACRDPSNLALEWLWLATIVTRDEHRRSCIRHALHIDRASTWARHLLAQLD